MGRPVTEINAIPLWAHQREAVDAIVRGLMDASSGLLPARDLRGTVIMATGTGKTRVAAESARRLVPDGLVCVVVPTLDLLTQTVAAWRGAGHDEPMIAVCSLRADSFLEVLGVRCTTNPAQLALWATEGGPVTIFATYASLTPQGLEDEGGDGAGGGAAPGVLERAMRGSFGLTLPPFDLLVVDEAHRTSGDLGKSWAAVLAQERIPAHRRLFMTATQRLWEVRQSADGSGRGRGPGKGSEGGVEGAEAGAEGMGRLVASMDDTSLYGERLFALELMEACERGLLASWEIDVLEIRDPDVLGPAATSEEIRGRRLAALQAALLKHHGETGTRSYLPFHTRTMDAMAFARAMPETAAELHRMDPAVYPARVGAEWLSGEHPAAYRREVLGRFADGVDAEGFVNDVQFLSSCQALSEGVDIRGRRGVDTVVFADTRTSQVQIVQIIGRALRQEPDEGKVARVVVPIFLAPGENPDDMMASPSYRPLVAVLQGLRAHDERVIQRLLLSTSGARGQATNVVALDPAVLAEQAEEQQVGVAEVAGRIVPVEGDDVADAPTEEAEAEDGEKSGSSGGAVSSRPSVRERAAGVPLLRFALPRNPDVIARFLRTRVLRPDSEVWLTGLNALRIWVEEHGDAEVPLHATIDLGDSGEPYTLGAWVSEQRRAQRAGTLKPWRIDLLDELGMVWSAADVKFSRNLAAARAYHTVHGHLVPGRDAAIEGVAVGEWLHNCRKKGGLGKKPDIADARRAALEAIDEHWNPSWPLAWQRGYAALKHLVGEEQTLPAVDGIRVNGVDVGRWLADQFEQWEELSKEQRELLTGLHATPPAPDAAEESTAEWVPRPVAGLAELTAFERGLAALQQYRERTGQVVVPRQHVEILHARMADAQTPGAVAEVPVKLGVWISNTKARRGKLSDQQLAWLAALGLEWAK
ncbi:DEAD/DEAH box helicase [Streptomyces radicis]|uniref:Helicase n=1 Tax=Streptomyces radicis TaxID=1750517 RepID=A0A3A9VQP8_9ACTN|nr:DEAD/DEAH box helicase [Streptomyces radicis]RKN03099.1 helicase [Streptomyces radicis]RKN13024.1 helicase [Streptomyces radicis]